MIQLCLSEVTPLLAVQCVKSIPAWLLLKAFGRRFPWLFTCSFSLTRLREVGEPKLPNARWARLKPLLSGICGSDLATITAKGSPFFVPLTSFPFTFGHEVVGIVVETGSEVKRVQAGDRVVVEPVLRCEVRGIEPACLACQQGHYQNCTGITQGDISAGVQTGYCRDTGGGWSSSLVAHDVQMHKVPEAVSNEEAVLVEPLSCALHAVLRAAQGRTTPFANALVLGCGSMGLLTIAALKTLALASRIIAVAKYPHQQELASKLGADQCVTTGSLYKELCNLSDATQHVPEIGKPTILGGFEAVFDCVGSADSLDDALRFTQSQGTTVLVGMPAIPKTVDWTTIWYKELLVKGGYTYGVEELAGQRLRTFELALRLLLERRVDIGSLVTHRFALQDYRQAIQTALFTGRHRSIKTVFEFLGGWPA